MVVKFICEYNGKNFCGFQRQSKGRSVQGVLEDALSKFIGEKVVITGCGRTDSGVHARMQVCSFQHNILCSMCDTQRNMLYRLQEGVNAILASDDIAVRDFSIAPDGFNARKWAKRKTYLYRVYVGRVPSPLRDEFCHRIPHVGRVLCDDSVKDGFDCDGSKCEQVVPSGGLVGGLTGWVDSLRDFAEKNFIGTRDFLEYSVQNTKQSTVRTIFDFRIELREDNGTELWFWVTGDGFLRRQVRMMVGKLLTGRRCALPAKGLTLWDVEY